MRTTLDIDDDVLQAAKEHARREKKTIGEILSALARRGLTASVDVAAVNEPQAIYSLRPFAHRGVLVTNGMVDRLRGDDAC